LQLVLVVSSLHAARQGRWQHTASTMCHNPMSLAEAVEQHTGSHSSQRLGISQDCHAGHMHSCRQPECKWA
jgi:hypothetical protein